MYIRFLERKLYINEKKDINNNFNYIHDNWYNIVLLSTYKQFYI